MMLHEFFENIDNFKDSKIDAVYKTLIAELATIEDTESRRFVLEELRSALIGLEQDDFFGTEGLQV